MDYRFNKKTSLSLSRSDVEHAGVYKFWGRASTLLYVGATRQGCGLQRPLDKQHHMRQGEMELDWKSVEFFPQDDFETALLLEAEWIREFAPKYNVKGITKHVRVTKSKRTIAKAFDTFACDFTVVVIGTNEVLFRSDEKYLRDRFFAQECKRISDRLTAQKGEEIKKLAREKESTQ
jgi:hypothetical protein